MSRAIVMLGAGGHAKVAIDACRAAGLEVRGILHRAGDAAGAVLDIPVLGDDSLLADPALAAANDFHVAIADNRTRLRLAESVIASGGRLATVRHPGAIVSGDAAIGPGCLLAAGAVVNPGVRLGRCVIVNTAASVDHDCDLADGVHVAPGARLAGGVSCGEGVLVGLGAVVVPGVSIGERAVVGAGAVVLGDIAGDITVVGAPARIMPQRRGGTAA